eukprot:COSAG02_NODE_26_length_51927_cov_61.213881_26_plen_176_part_00
MGGRTGRWRGISTCPLRRSRSSRCRSPRVRKDQSGSDARSPMQLRLPCGGRPWLLQTAWLPVYIPCPCLSVGLPLSLSLSLSLSISVDTGISACVAVRIPLGCCSGRRRWLSSCVRVCAGCVCCGLLQERGRSGGAAAWGGDARRQRGARAQRAGHAARRGEGAPRRASVLPAAP